jgi:hypothetical protein
MGKFLCEIGNKYRFRGVHYTKENVMKIKQFTLYISLVLAAIILTACGTIVSANIYPQDKSHEAPPLPPTPAQEENSVTPFMDFDQVRDLAVSAAALKAGIQIPDGSWNVEDTTPSGLVGVSSRRYIQGPWVVEISAPVVLPENRVFSVMIDHMSQIFRWEGQVDDGGNVTETMFILGEPAEQPGDSVLPVFPPGPVDPVLPDQEIGSWIGVIVSNPAGAQFDDYFQMLDQNGTRCGIDSVDVSVREMLVSYRDSGTLLKVYGTLQDGMDAYGRQISVTGLEEYKPQSN